jgi:predicted phage replisome organizer
MAKKYYWLKLKRDFFKRHDIRIIEEMENGKDYILLYLKLLVESIDHNGELRFSDTIPYSDKMISTITNTNIDIVRSAMKVFQELKFIEVMDDETIFMSQVSEMIGSQTEWAEKKRLYRDKQKALEQTEGQKKDMSDKSKSIELEKEIDKEKEQKEEIVLDEPEIKFNEKQEKFLKYLCNKFGATEQRFPQNYMLIHRAITKKITEGEYEWFAGQCYFYFKYKEHEEEKVHSLKTFIGDLDEMSTGGWNAENWDKKYQSVKKAPKPENHVQPSRRQPGSQKRGSGPQSIKSIRK